MMNAPYVEYRLVSDDDLLRLFILNKSKLMPSGCWEWQGAHTRGYGTLMRERQRRYVHHLSYELWRGDKLPTGMVMRHDCDNPKCVNPNHLSPGTQAENLRDMTRRGRHGRRKLTAADVLAIRASDEPSTILAEKFGLGIMAVRRARGGQTWKHVPLPSKAGA